MLVILFSSSLSVGHTHFVCLCSVNVFSVSHWLGLKQCNPTLHSTMLHDTTVSLGLYARHALALVRCISVMCVCSSFSSFLGEYSFCSFLFHLLLSWITDYTWHVSFVSYHHTRYVLDSKGVHVLRIYYIVMYLPLW